MTVLVLLCATVAGAETSSPVQLATVTIQGTVTGPGGQPLAGARVAIVPPDFTDGDDVFADTVTDVDGRFALLAIPLPAGQYVVHASGIGFDIDEKRFEVKADPVNLSIDLALKPPARTRGPSTPYTVVRVHFAPRILSVSLAKSPS